MPHKTPTSTWLRRISPLAGAGCAVLTIAAYLVIGPNPDSNASTTKITAYYAAHHDHVRLAGMLLGYAAALFALFGVTVWTRIRETAVQPFLAGTVLVATAVATASNLVTASGWYLLGGLGDKHTIAPGAIQGLHISVSAADLPAAAGLGLFLVALAAAGLLGRTFPRWIAWPALILGTLQLLPTPGTTIGFVAGLLILPWLIAASVAMARSTTRTTPALQARRPAPIADPA